MNPLSMFLGTKQQKGDGMFQSEYSLGYLLLNFLVLILSVSLRLYIKVLALAERNPGRLIN